MIAYLMDPVYM
jgi:hypothetical protein